MPNYKDGSVFNQRPNDQNFDAIYAPGCPTPFSGIYKCVSCGYEAVSTRGNSLPPTKVCTDHSPSTWKCSHGPVRWRLVAAAIHVSSNA